MLLQRIGPDRYLLADDRVLDWIAARISRVGPKHDWHGRARGLGVVLNGEIVAGMAVLDHDRKHGNAEIAMAADSARWATRATIATMLAYPFGQLGCQRLTTVIEAGNDRAIRFNEGLGFKREGLIRRAYGDADAVIMGLLKEDLPAWARSPIIDGGTVAPTLGSV